MQRSDLLITFLCFPIRYTILGIVCSCNTASVVSDATTYQPPRIITSSNVSCNGGLFCLAAYGSTIFCQNYTAQKIQMKVGNFNISNCRNGTGRREKSEGGNVYTRQQEMDHQQHLQKYEQCFKLFPYHHHIPQ